MVTYISFFEQYEDELIFEKIMNRSLNRIHGAEWPEIYAHLK